MSEYKTAPTNAELDAYWLPGRTKDEAGMLMAQSTASCARCGRTLYVIPSDERIQYVCAGDCQPSQAAVGSATEDSAEQPTLELQPEEKPKKLLFGKRK